MNESLTNLVAFPAGRKLKEPSQAPLMTGDDPLAELLKECSELGADEHEEVVAPTLEFSAVQEPNLLSPGDLISYMQTQIHLLREAHRRMEYYVEEIEAYLPQK